MQIPSNPQWSQQTRDVHLSYGVEILTDDYFIFIIFVTIHAPDRQTDRIVTAIPCLSLHAVTQ